MFGILIKGHFPSNAWEKSSALAVPLRRFKVANFNRNNDDKDSNDEAKTPEDGKKQKVSGDLNAKDKLNDLLKLMVKEGPLVNVKDEGLRLAKPKRMVKPKAAKTVKDGIITSIELEKKLAEATKNVAESLGGDTKETESELLQKLLSTKGPTNLSDLISGMKIDHGEVSSTRKDMPKDWNQIRRENAQMRKPLRHMTEDGRRGRFDRGELTHIDLFGGPKLDIFGNETSKDVNPPESLKVWEKQEEREIRLSASHPPRNYFQQMIVWTEQGKLWKFPIDNEQGMEEEEKVFFTEHVFLEPHLDPWCPKKGPVRQFMELVCVGLSKNPYMTVQMKKDTISWYAEYFEAKKDILQELGALPQ